MSKYILKSKNEKHTYTIDMFGKNRTEAEQFAEYFNAKNTFQHWDVVEI